MATTSPTVRKDLEPRVAGDTWDPKFTFGVGGADLDAPGTVVFMTIKATEDPSEADPGYAQRRSDESGVTLEYDVGDDQWSATFTFTAAETEAMRERAGTHVFYDVAVCASSSRKTTTHRGRIPVLIDITQEPPG